MALDFTVSLPTVSLWQQERCRQNLNTVSLKSVWVVSKLSKSLENTDDVSCQIILKGFLTDWF